MPGGCMIIVFLLFSAPGLSLATTMSLEFDRILKFDPDTSGIDKEEHQGVGTVLCSAICSKDQKCVALLMDQQNNCCLVLHSYLKSSVSTQPNNIVYLRKKDCLPGWTRRNDKCYLLRIKPNAANWPNALLNCRMLGTQVSLSQPVYLAEPMDDDENTFIVTIAPVNPWIGGSDAHREGMWVYSSNGAVLSYTNWRPGEPSDVSWENCVQILSDTLWNDSPCGNVKPYLCEYKL